MKHTLLVSWILTAFSEMAVRSAKFAHTGGGTTSRRVRTPGKPGPSGAKLARKAREHRLGMPSGTRHG